MRESSSKALALPYTLERKEEIGGEQEAKECWRSLQRGNINECREDTGDCPLGIARAKGQGVG